MSWTNNLLVIFVSSIIGLILFELMLSVSSSAYSNSKHLSRTMSNLELHDHEHHFCYGPRDRMKFDNELIAVEHENQQYFEFRNKSVSLHTYNKFGFRFPINEQVSDKNVVVLGDSFARGTLADDTETIPSFLTRWSNGIVFYNFGIAGHGPSQHFINYKRHASKFKHDYVILLHYLGNDANNELDLSCRLIRAKQIFEKNQSNELGAQKLKNFIESFHIGRLLLDAKRTFQTSSKKKSLPEPIVIANLIERPIKQILDAAQSNGKKLAIVTIPTREVYDDKNFPVHHNLYKKEIMELQKNVINRLSEQNGTPVLHLDEAFEDMDLEILNLYGWPDAHFHEEGYYLSAIKIGEFLSKTFQLSFNFENEFISMTNFEPSSAKCPAN